MRVRTPSWPRDAAARYSSTQLVPERASGVLGVTSEPRALVAGAEGLDQAVRPRLNNKASGDDLAAMETKNNVLAGNISTEEGERSSRRVQQPAVWSLGLSRRWPVPLVLMIGSAGIDMPAHAGHGIGCVGCNSWPWGRPGSQGSREAVQERASGAGASDL